MMYYKSFSLLCIFRKGKTFLFYSLSGIMEHKQIRQELDEMRKHVSNLDIPVALCHNDFWATNIILDPSEGQF